MFNYQPDCASCDEEHAFRIIIWKQICRQQSVYRLIIGNQTMSQVNNVCFV